MRYFLVLCLVFCSSIGWAGPKEVVKQACVLMNDYKDKNISELKKILLNQAKREALSEIYGEYVSSKTEVTNFQLTSDMITSKSLGILRIKGDPFTTASAWSVSALLSRKILDSGILCSEF